MGFLNKWALVLLVLVLSATSLHAQQQAEPDVDEARQLYEESELAAEEGRFADAVVLLQRALSITPRTGVAFNLGVALRGTGQLLEAERVWKKLLAGDFGKLELDQIAEVRALLLDVRADVATLELRVRGASEAIVRLDATDPIQLLADSMLPVRVDPGEHVIRSSAEGFSDFETRVVASHGQKVAVTLNMKADAAVLQEHPAHVPLQEEETSLLESPWFWVVSGLLVAGGATVGWMVLQDEPGEAVPSHNIFGTVETLRLTK